MPALNFYLSALNQSFTLSVAATLENDQSNIPFTDAIIQINVSLSAFKSIFKFHADSIDLNDINSTDLLYYVYPNNWPSLNANSLIVTSGRLNIIGRSTSTLSQDFIAYLAFKLFGNANFCDLFNNKSTLYSYLNNTTNSLLTNINNFITNIGISGTNINLVTDASGNKYFTNDVSDTAGGPNVCRAILKYIAYGDNSRFSTFTSGNNIQSIPFILGDSISFIWTINAAATQENITGVASIPPRTYLIQLAMNLE